MKNPEVQLDISRLLPNSFFQHCLCISFRQYTIVHQRMCCLLIVYIAILVALHSLTKDSRPEDDMWALYMFQLNISFFHEFDSVAHSSCWKDRLVIEMPSFIAVFHIMWQFHLICFHICIYSCRDYCLFPY